MDTFTVSKEELNLKIQTILAPGDPIREINRLSGLKQEMLYFWPISTIPVYLSRLNYSRMTDPLISNLEVPPTSATKKA